jgi:hypothetical protein
MAVSPYITVKDKECIKEHVKGSVPMKLIIVTKQHSDALHKMKKLLTVLIRDHKEMQTLLSLTTEDKGKKSLCITEGKQR